MTKLLTEFGKQDIDKIIQQFGEQQRIFHCEAQFQFELAWELQKLFDEQPKIKVKLEVIKQSISNAEDSSEKRFYTDIVIEDCATQNYVAIELKYKTAKYSDGQIELRHHAAQSLGRFDFLWDVQRNEHLVNNKEARFGDCIKAISIMLTNDSSYWNKAKEEGLKEYLYKDFELSEGRHVPCEKLQWNMGDRTCKQLENSVGKWRKKAVINLSGDYTCKWQPYCTKNGDRGKFKYLLLECPK